MSDESDDLRALLEMLDPPARDTLRRVLIHDQADRDAISSLLLRYRDQNGQIAQSAIDEIARQVRAALISTGRSNVGKTGLEQTTAALTRNPQ